MDAIFDDLRSQLNGLLVHHYKRMQAAHFAKLITECNESECNESLVALQVNFSENASLLQQNEIQAAYCPHQVTIFTAHAWIGEGVKESFPIVSESLNHTKEVVYIFMSVLFLRNTLLLEQLMFSVMGPYLSSNNDIYFEIFMIGKRSFHLV